MTTTSGTSAVGLRGWAERRKYELLLFGLIQHLFAAMLVPDLRVYNQIVWPINMIVLGITSVGVFSGASLERRVLRWVLAVIVIGFPSVPLFVSPTAPLMALLSVTYLLFFASIFVEVLRYMLRDVEYFCAITLTTIGFGDVTPTHHVARLLTAFLGITGQIYSVVLMGILISKYTSSTQDPAS